MKNTLGINSGVDEAEDQNIDMEDKEAESTQQNSTKKKESKNMLLGQLQTYQHFHHRGAKPKRARN